MKSYKNSNEIPKNDLTALKFIYKKGKKNIFVIKLVLKKIILFSINMLKNKKVISQNKGKITRLAINFVRKRVKNVL